MLDVILSNRFKKDLKLAAKRGMNLAELDAIVEQLTVPLRIPVSLFGHLEPHRFLHRFAISLAFGIFLCYTVFRKQLRGFTALLGLEYRGKAVFFFAIFPFSKVSRLPSDPHTSCT